MEVGPHAEVNEAQDRLAGRSDKSRTESFSDGVLSVFITLMVLDLRPPESEPGGLLSALVKQWPAYLAYLSSYLYIAVIWLNHKAAFKRIRVIDHGLHWANVGVLFATALLPFATAIVAEALRRDDPADARTAVALYALVGALQCACWLRFYHYLSRHPELIAKGVEAGFFDRERTRAWGGIVIYLVAGALGHQVAPLLAMGIFLVVPVFLDLTHEGL